MSLDMALAGWLETDNLLVVIASLLTIMNYNQSRIKGFLRSSTKYLKTLKGYFAEDIRIRNRLERKADMILSRTGVDIEKLNTSINMDTDMNLRIDLEDLNGDIDFND
jgi:hypothetical protein